MNRTRTSRTTRRLVRAAMFFCLLASMMKAMPLSASPAIWSIKIARPAGFNCDRGLGICIDLFGPIDGTARTRVSLEVSREELGQTGTRGARMVFLSPLEQKDDTFFVDEDVALDRARSVELGYSQVTILKGSYPIDRSNDPNGEVMLHARTIGITITADIGRKAYGCERFGVCSVTVGFDFGKLAPGAGSASLDGNRLGWDFLLPVETEEDSSIIYVDEDIVLDEQASLALGAKGVTILKGAYAVDYSENPNGHVDFAVQRIGITVTFDIGRKRYDCTRAGICAITVGAELSMRNPTPGVVSLDRHAVTLDFTRRPNIDRDEPFVLDDDYVIDRDLALRLGRQSITLMAGEYAVDYSSNPNGRVVIPATTQGIVVTIHIGRPSRNCRGFGFCGITIDASAAFERSVQAVLSIGDDVMSIDFLGETPEQGDVLEIENDMSLDAATTRRFGVGHVTVLKGRYNVDYTSNPFGHLEVPVRLSGITVEITFGRRGCEWGFGICRIIIARAALNPSSDRMSFASIEKSAPNLMTLNFSERMPFAGDTLFIDDDVVLDGTGGSPAGAERLLIKRGAYPVDYSTNPNGSVTVVTELDGAASVGSDELAGSTLALWPNPATGSATTRFTADGIETVRLELLDAQGSVVMTIVDGERLERGEHERTLDLSGLPAGAYFERLSIGTTNTVRALQIIR